MTLSFFSLNLLFSHSPNYLCECMRMCCMVLLLDVLVFVVFLFLLFFTTFKWKELSSNFLSDFFDFSMTIPIITTFSRCFETTKTNPSFFLFAFFLLFFPFSFLSLFFFFFV